MISKLVIKSCITVLLKLHVFSLFLLIKYFTFLIQLIPGIGHMTIGDLRVADLLHHAMHGHILLVQTIPLLQDKGGTPDIPGLLYCISFLLNFILWPKLLSVFHS